MFRRALPPIIATVALLGAPLLAPDLALASGGSSSGGSGGAGLSGGSGSSGTGTAVTPADGTVTASGHGITVRTRAAGMTGRITRFTGRAPARDAGDIVEIERLSVDPGSYWLNTASATVRSGGAFSVAWAADRSGAFKIRAVLLSRSRRANTARTNAAAAAASGPASASLAITVYRSARATLYGPGFYGHRTACGQTLRRSTVGVASRTLACGTRVTVFYDGRAMTVPVIDRGPYANDATWDLTMVTARDLRIEGTSTVGTVTASPAR